MSYQYVLPGEIEKRSFEILTKELGDRKLLPENEPVIKRVIHTTADFDYVDNLVFSDGAVNKSCGSIPNAGWNCDRYADGPFRHP